MDMALCNLLTAKNIKGSSNMVKWMVEEFT